MGSSCSLFAQERAQYWIRTSSAHGDAEGNFDGFGATQGVGGDYVSYQKRTGFSEDA